MPNVGRTSRKKRANGEGSIFKEASGRYRVSVTTFVNGKRVRKTKTAWSNADAVAILAKLRGSPILPQSCGAMTLATWVDKWLNEIASTRCEATTVDNYRWSANTHVKPSLGGILLAKLRPIQIQNWLAEMVESEVGSCAREGAFIVLSAALQSAVDLEVIATDPSDKIRKPKRDDPDIDPFTIEESKSIIKAATGTRHEAIVMLAFASGMRPGEMFAVHKSVIDWKNSQLRVEQTVSNASGKRGLKKPKTDASKRIVNLTSDCMDALKRHAETIDGELMFTAPMGGLIDRNTFRNRVWRPLLEKAGVRFRPLHHTRHTYATLSLAAGVPITVVSAQLGHARTSTTLDIYAHALAQHCKTGVDIVQNLFR